MFLPFKTKNPPEHFPICTTVLIVLNVLFYGMSSYENFFLVVSRSAVDSFAVSHNTLNLFRLSSAMFMHASLLHLAGNMLFLWIFGGAAEGRARPVKFLLAYFLAGYTGGLLSDLLNGVSNPDTPSLGASGAIMGIAGAYLYLFPHSIVKIAYMFWYRFGVMEWRAWLVILYYIGLDMLSAILLKETDGIGHFAHLGGFGAGLLCMLAFRVKRDNEEASNAKAMLDDIKDYSYLSVSELEAILAQTPTQNMDLVMTYLEKATAANGNPATINGYLTHYSNQLFLKAPPERLANLALRSAMPLNINQVQLLRIGSLLEQNLNNTTALQVYHRVYEMGMQTRESENALFRTGNIYAKAFNDPARASASYNEMLRLFPTGDLAHHAKQAMQRLGR